ncbi:hypothetical protein [Paenibacillus sp. Soil522]|uniref:hypothetical protein n=1 Tax=Paenibacillus sp. Soil522 TaxID=1736388 RepID=UPI0006F63C7F|nr:hypothetical protein [Paenibacillus sp. Soil522]KRE39993.1 hypothetical protein ASG81_18915 [Paenibacillus sp. Soil522]
MKIKFGILSCAILVVLTGCLANPSDKRPENVKVEANWVVDEDKLTLDHVKKAIEAEGVELFLRDEKNDWVLNQVKPNRFSIGWPTEKTVRPEYISIYIYKTEQARKEGLDDFNMQKEKYDMQIPNIYEHKNALILYWHHENVDNAHNSKFGSQIEAAIQKI